MHDYKIEVQRDKRWWMVTIPDIGGVTQARRLSEVEQMAKEYIALAKNVPIEAISVETASIRMAEPEFVELLDGAREIAELRGQAKDFEKKTTEAMRQYALWLTACGIPVRDIADLLDISPQRVSQLANMQPNTP